MQVKLKARLEIGSSIIFEHNGIIHVLASKISNVFDAENEIKIELGSVGSTERRDIHNAPCRVLAKSDEERRGRSPTNEPNNGKSEAAL